MITRRSALKRSIATVLAVSVPTFSAAASPKGVRVGFSVDGHKFGLVLTETTKGLLVTVRSLSKNFRTSAFVARGGEGERTATLKGGGRSVEVSVNKAGDLVLAGKGLLLNNAGPNPPQDGPSPQGWFGNLLSSIGSAIADAVTGIAVGIGVAISWLIGARITFRGKGWVIAVQGDGTILFAAGGPSSGFMPPPDGTGEQPGVWY